MAAPNSNSGTLTDRLIGASGVLAIVLLAVALAGNYSAKIPFNVVQGLRYAGFAFIAFFVLGSVFQNKDTIGDLMARRTTKQGANSLVVTVAVLVIAVVLNFLGQRYHQRFDLTTNKQFSLAPQSKQIAKDIKTDLKLTAFIRSGDPQGRNLKDLITEYSFASDHLKLEIVDPEREYGKVKLFFEAHPTASQRANTLFIDNNGKLTECQTVSEQDVTAALMKAIATKQLTIYVMQGHGESSLTAFDQNGFNQAKEALEKQNYKVSGLSLFDTKNTVPADCDLLMIPGPRKAFLPQELDAIEAYLKKGGRMHLMLGAQSTNTGLERLTKLYGITPDNDMVIDNRSFFLNDPAVPVVQNWQYHKITESLQPAIFPAARSLTLDAKAPKGVNRENLADSSDQSFGKTNLSDRKITLDPRTDIRGPLHLAEAVTTDATESVKATRQIISGNSLFATNQFLQMADNSAFFLNTVNWVTDQDNLVSIPAKNAAPAMVSLTGSQQNLIFAGTVAGAPLSMLLAGGVIWWRRRRS